MTAWVKSYLSNRKQFVNIDGCSSELLDFICGVPQGSVLGPTLFILYINDICNVSKFVKFILFADDTNVFCAGDNQLELECMLNRELAKLCKWFAVNKLSLHLSKTSCFVLYCIALCFIIMYFVLCCCWTYTTTIPYISWLTLPPCPS